MNAKQFARLRVLAVESYRRGEMTADEFTDLMTAMGKQTFAAGIEEEFMAAYTAMCLVKTFAAAAK
jgi:hypothetical protein